MLITVSSRTFVRNADDSLRGTGGRGGNHAIRSVAVSTLAKLFKAKEEEGSIVPVVDLGNGNWPAKGEPVIILPQRVPNVLALLGGVERARIGER